METQPEYRVAARSNLSALEKFVTEQMREGFKLQGGVFVKPDVLGGSMYFQAMTREGYEGSDR